MALLQRFRYTGEGYRDKFRNAGPEEGETCSQFAARITGCFDRWVELAEVKNYSNKLKEQMTSEQFLRTCSNRLAVFLKERSCVTLKSLAKNADLYLEAQSYSSS